MPLGTKAETESGSLGPYRLPLVVPAERLATQAAADELLEAVIDTLKEALTRIEFRCNRVPVCPLHPTPMCPSLCLIDYSTSKCAAPSSLPLFLYFQQPLHTGTHTGTHTHHAHTQTHTTHIHTHTHINTHTHTHTHTHNHTLTHT